MIPFIDLQLQYKKIKKDIDASIQKVLDHGQYVMGPEIGELEKILANYVQTKHCITVSSGTDAQLMALMALDIGPGDEVIIPDFSFFATCEVVLLVGATPVFVDIDPKTYNMDPKLVEKAITKKTKAIMPVSLYGQCADFDAINSIASRHSITVIEDAAQSFGARYKNKLSCSLSRIGCTSFFPSKPLGCYGDGGAIFTNDDQLAEKLKAIRIHGQTGRYVHTYLGINGRMDTLQATILIQKMKIFEEEMKLRQIVAERYHSLLSKKVRTPQIESHNLSAFAQYTIEVNNRDQFAQNLNKAGVPTAVHYPGVLSVQPLIAGKYKCDTPIARQASEKVISLPFHPYMDAETQEKVVSAIISNL